VAALHGTAQVCSAHAKKPAEAGFFAIAGNRSARARRARRNLRCCLQALDGCGEAALAASGLVLVNDLLVGDRVDRLDGSLEQLGSLCLVAGVDGLANSLDRGAELAMTVPYPVLFPELGA